MIWCVSGMLWGGALLQSVLVGAQTGWTGSRKVLAVIMMTTCVGAVGIDERASASRRFLVSDAAPCQQHVMVRPSIRIGVDLAAVGGGLAWAVRSADGTGGGRVGSPLARVGICTASLPMPATVCSKCLPRLWAGLRARGSTICARSNTIFVAMLCA